MSTKAKVYEDEDLTPSQRADLARSVWSALHVVLANTPGWTRVRPDRWQETDPNTGKPGAVVETTYVYGETRAKMWASPHSQNPVAVLSFIGRTRDHAQMDRFKKLVGAAL